jgi:hypothetical protein
MTSRTRRLLPLLGALALLATVTVPADAGPQPPLHRARLAPLVPALNKLRANLPNPGFGGYLARQTGATSIVAQFEVPKLICTSQFTGIGPGAFLIAGPSGHEVFDFAGLILGCTGGQADNQETLVLNNVEYDFFAPMHPGDVMMVQLSINPGSTVVQVSNLTGGNSFVFTRRGRGAVARSELVGEDAALDASTNEQLPIPNFGTLGFRSVLIGGNPIGLVGPTAYDMQTSAKVLQISTGPFLGNGTAFNSIFKHS